MAATSLVRPTVEHTLELLKAHQALIDLLIRQNEVLHQKVIQLCVIVEGVPRTHNHIPIPLPDGGPPLPVGALPIGADNLNDSGDDMGEALAAFATTTAAALGGPPIPVEHLVNNIPRGTPNEE